MYPQRRNAGRACDDDNEDDDDRTSARVPQRLTASGGVLGNARNRDGLDKAGRMSLLISPIRERTRDTRTQCRFQPREVTPIG